MQDDERCCGTGTCLINAQGACWCGQQWDGEKMCRQASPGVASAKPEARLGAENQAAAQGPNEV